MQQELELIKGAEVFVHKVNDIVPIIAYITNRPTTVLEGTMKWLEKHKFPKAEMILRPTTVEKEDGNIWKAKVLEGLYPNIEGIVDDNPGLIDNLDPNYKGVVYLFDYEEEYKNGEIEVIPCKDWEEVLKQIKGKY